MAFKKISDLSSSLSPSGDGIIPISQNGETYGTTLNTIKGQLTGSFATTSSVNLLTSSIDSVESSINSLNSFTSSASGRLDSLEQFTGSLNDSFATDAELTEFREYFNTYTSSNNNVNTQQNNRLDALELGASNTATDLTGIHSRLDSIEVTTGSLTTQIETEKGRIDAILLASDADKDSFKEIVDLINSVDTENDTAFAGYVLQTDGRLDSIESKTGSYATISQLLGEVSAINGRMATTGSNSFIGDQNVNGSINATSLTGSIDFNNLTNKPIIVSGSEQISYTGITDTPTGFTYHDNEIGVNVDVFDFGDNKTIDMQNSTILMGGSTIDSIKLTDTTGGFGNDLYSTTITQDSVFTKFSKVDYSEDIFAPGNFFTNTYDIRFGSGVLEFENSVHYRDFGVTNRTVGGNMTISAGHGEPVDGKRNGGNLFLWGGSVAYGGNGGNVVINSNTGDIFIGPLQNTNSIKMGGGTENNGNSYAGGIPTIFYGNVTTEGGIVANFNGPVNINDTLKLTPRSSAPSSVTNGVLAVDDGTNWSGVADNGIALVVYLNGWVLVAPHDHVTPTPTSTDIPPTATPQPTPVPTATEIPPTATPTETPVPTATEVPQPTPTDTPSSTFDLVMGYNVEGTAIDPSGTITYQLFYDAIDPNTGLSVAGGSMVDAIGGNVRTINLSNIPSGSDIELRLRRVDPSGVSYGPGAVLITVPSGNYSSIENTSGISLPFFYAAGYNFTNDSQHVWTVKGADATTDIQVRVTENQPSGVPTATPTDTPLPTATPTDTPVPTATPTDTPVPTPTPTDTPIPTATPTDTPLPTSTEVPPSPTPTDTPVPTATPTDTPIPTATEVPPTATPTDTPIPTATPTDTPVPTSTETPTPTPLPTLVVNSPTNLGIYLPGQITMSLDVGDFISSGQGHIHYNLDSTGVVMKYDTSDVIFNITSEGAHVLVVSLVDNQHQQFNPPISETINFTVQSPTPTPTDVPPTPTPTDTPVPTSTEVPPTPTPTDTPVPTATPTDTPVPTATEVPTPTPTPTVDTANTIFVHIPN